MYFSPQSLYGKTTNFSFVELERRAIISTERLGFRMGIQIFGTIRKVMMVVQIKHVMTETLFYYATTMRGSLEAPKLNGSNGFH